MDLRDTTINRVCPVNLITECPSAKYRTYSGHCNNVNHPLWGASSEPMQRLLKPSYADSQFFKNCHQISSNDNIYNF